MPVVHSISHDLVSNTDLAADPGFSIPYLVHQIDCGPCTSGLQDDGHISSAEMLSHLGVIFAGGGMWAGEIDD